MSKRKFSSKISDREIDRAFKTLWVVIPNWGKKMLPVAIPNCKMCDSSNTKSPIFRLHVMIPDCFKKLLSKTPITFITEKTILYFAFLSTFTVKMWLVMQKDENSLL